MFMKVGHIMFLKNSLHLTIDVCVCDCNGRIMLIQLHLDIALELVIFCE